jgi:D-alanyl-D-alanine carboxypeptidase (penicillin-binding protein 5/6)
MKRFASLMLVLIFLSASLPAAALSAPSIDLRGAGAALLIDADSGQVLFEKNAYEPCEVAGLKRLPALLAVCRAFDSGLITEDTTVTVSPDAAKVRGATAFLSPGERISAGELLKAAVIIGAGDSICALVSAIYPGAEALEAINGALLEIGAGVRLSDAMGEGDKIALSDIARICCALTESGTYLKYSSIYLDSLAHENGSVTELANPNRLVRFYSGCFGIGTGSVGSSEYCGAFIARRGNTTFLAAVAGLPDSASRFALASDLLDRSFSAYRKVELGAAGESLGRVSVSGGTQGFVEVLTEKAVSALMPVSDTKLLSEAYLPESIEAPIEKGAPVGTLVIKNSMGEKLGEVPLIAAETVPKATFRDRFLMLISGWLRL